MQRHWRTRRGVLIAGSTATLAALAGCTGGGDDSDETGRGDAGDDGTSGGTDDADTDGNGNSDADPGGAWEGDVPDDSAFLANPDVEGPGGSVGYILATTVRDFAEVDEYDRFEVTIDSVALQTADETTVSVPVGATVDLAAYETGPAGDVITLAWNLSIPADTYTALTLEVTPVELIHEDAGDVTDLFEAPPTADFASDDGTEVFEDSVLRTMMDLEVIYDSLDSVATFEESLSVGTTTMESVALDPEQYEND